MTRQQLVEKLLELHRLRKQASDIEAELLAAIVEEDNQLSDAAHRGHDTVPVRWPSLRLEDL